jgi:hypothetical protein
MTRAVGGEDRPQAANGTARKVEQPAQSAIRRTAVIWVS